MYVTALVQLMEGETFEIDADTAAQKLLTVFEGNVITDTAIVTVQQTLMNGQAGQADLGGAVIKTRPRAND